RPAGHVTTATSTDSGPLDSDPGDPKHRSDRPGEGEPSAGASVGTSGPLDSDPGDRWPGSRLPGDGEPSAGALSAAGLSGTVNLTRGSAGPIRGSINLTVPLATWLGGSGEPGHAAGFGPLDADDSRDLADALAAGPGGRWCITFTGADGCPVAHGCARTAPPGGLPRPQRGPGPRAGPGTEPRAGPGTEPRAGPGTEPRAGPGTEPRAGPGTEPRAGPGTRLRDGTWTFTMTPLGGPTCDHASATPRYRPSVGLRHLLDARQPAAPHPG